MATRSLPCPNNQADFRALIEDLTVAHPRLRQQALLFFLRREKEDQSEIVASTVQEGKFGTLHLLFELLGRPELAQAGFVERQLSETERDSLLGGLTPFHADAASHPNVAFLQKATAENTPVTVGIVAQMSDALKKNPQYLSYRTTLVFDLFNHGALRGIDGLARQALLDSFGSLPTRPLTADGRFLLGSNEEAQLIRKCRAWTAAGSEHAVAGFDKFPSLMAVRGKQLLTDGNRIVPTVMIRDGVYVGKRNIFMFHAAVNLAASIGDDNLIDSHASIASAAQIGDRNKIGSFVSLEGVLSPANARPVVIGDDNFIGTFARIGTGITIGSGNFIGAGVNLSLGTKLKDCRRESSTKGEYLTVEDINRNFEKLALMPNNAARSVEGVDVFPGEYLLMENTEDFMKRFEGDSRIKAAK